MTVHKASLIEALYYQTGLEKKQAAKVLETMVEAIKRALQSGEGVLISGFGKFEVKEKGRRRGRNPQTGDSLTLPARRVVTFRCSKVLKDKLNARG